MTVARSFRPSTMYEESRGAFRLSLDRWRLAMLETKDRFVQRRLNQLIEKVADRWLKDDPPDDLAKFLDAELARVDKSVN